MRTQRIPPQKKGPNGEKLCRWCCSPVPKGRRTFCGNECVHEAMLRSDPGYLRQKTKQRDQGVCADCGIDTEALKRQYLQVAKLAREGLDAYDRIRKKASARYGPPGIRWWDIQHRMTSRDTEEQIAIERRRAVETWKGTYRWAQEKGVEPPEHPDDQIRYTSRWERMRADAITLTGEEERMVRIHRRLKRLAEARRVAMVKQLERDGFRGSANRYKLTNLWQADHIVPVAEGGGLCGLENIQTLCRRCHRKKTADQARRAALIRRGVDPDAPDPQARLAI